MIDNPRELLDCAKTCYANSQRLLRDSEAANISPPTRGALVEIALEEALKSYNLIGYVVERFSDVMAPSSFADAVEEMPFINNPDMDEILLADDGIFEDDKIERIFRDHVAKLRAGRYLAKITSGAILSASRDRDSLLKGARKVFSIMGYSGGVNLSDAQLVNEFISWVNSYANMTDNMLKSYFLDQMKEGGFYIDAKGNKCVPAKSTDRRQIAFVREFTVKVHLFLKAMIDEYLKRLDNFGRVSR